jgi:hypothetical protein
MSAPGDPIDDVFRSARAPVGAAPRDEIFARAVRGAETRIRRREVMVRGGAAVAAAGLAAALYLVWTSPGEAPIARSADGAAISAGETIAIAAGQSERLALPGGGTIAIEGPASLSLAPATEPALEARIELEDGAIETSGAFELECAECRARLEGRVGVRRERATLRTSMRVTAGSVEILRGSCAVVYEDLDAPEPPEATGPSEGAEAPREGAEAPWEGAEAPWEGAEAPGGGGEARSEPGAEAPSGAEAVERDPARAPAGERPGAEAMEPPETAEAPERSADALLAERIDRFDRASAMVASDPEAALRDLHALRDEWPGSPVRAEIDYAILDALLRTGRRDEARALATELSERHGARRRADLVQRALEAEP